MAARAVGETDRSTLPAARISPGGVPADVRGGFFDAARGYSAIRAAWTALRGRGPDRGVDDAQVEALTRDSLRWVLLGAIAFRIGMTLPAGVLNRAVLGSAEDPLLILLVTVVVVDGAMLVVVARRPDVLARRWLLPADMLLPLVLTVAATALIVPGTYLVPGDDAMTGYGWGTIGLWSVLRGWRTGAGVCAVMVASLVGMSALNGAVLDVQGISSLVLRTGFALMAWLLPGALRALAVRGARGVVVEGLRAGRLAERVALLRTVHDTSLADFEAVVLVADRAAKPLGWRLDQITGFARRRLADSADEETDSAVDAAAADLRARIDALTGEFAARGLIVETRCAGAGPAPDEHVAAALAEAVREALNNVAKHAGTGRALVEILHTEGGMAVTVTDTGRGFAVAHVRRGHGLRESITARITEAGGGVLVESQPGSGTRVRLQMPLGEPHPVTSPLVSARAVKWFALLPVGWRILSVPVVAFMVTPLVAASDRAGYALVLVILLVGNVVLAGSLRTRLGARLLTGSTGFALLDVGVAVALLLWTATLVAPGTALGPGPDGAWTYLMPTVQLWIVARGARLGFVVPPAVALLIGAVVVVNGGPDPGGQPMLEVQHLVLVLAAAAGAVLVMHTAQRAAEQADEQSRRAGRARERLEVLTALDARIHLSWAALARLGGAEPTPATLLRIRGIALTMAAELRAVLAADPPVRGLVAALHDVATAARAQGVRIELVSSELTADPPPDVVTALADAVRTALRASCAHDNSQVIVHVRGSATRTCLTVRDHRAPDGPPAREQLSARMAAVHGTARVTAVADRGSRTELAWGTR